jgi:predicted nucleic acid-binding protein
MTAVFADTFYFIALLNADDEAHAAADEFAGDASLRLVTSAWILTELADGLAETDGRKVVRNLLTDLETDPRVEVVLPEPGLWRRGIDLYADRPDKEWSLTDCLSFVIMKDRALTDALTADHHFIQAGFRALLKPPGS